MHPTVFESAGASHVGCVRDRNEDAWVARPDSGLWAVADGMGGLTAGDVAAQAIAAALAAAADALTGPPDQRAAAVEAALQTVHRDLIDEAGSRGGTIGSTAVVGLATDGQLACLWAGDSRAYLWGEDRLSPVSHDHSRVQELIDQGEISPTAARHHPQSHIVTRALGIRPTLSVECRSVAFPPGHRLLLCSDGLTQMLEDDEIAAVLAAGTPPAAVCDILIGLALDRGGHDNVTVVVADCRSG